MAYYGKDIDRETFNKMQTATREAPDRLFEEGKIFTESPYNTTYDDLSRYAADRNAFQVLQQLFEEDKSKSENIKDWDFGRYLENLSDSRLESIFSRPKKQKYAGEEQTRVGDPTFYHRGGELLTDVYADDIEQLKLSAYNFYATKGDRSAAKDRSNVSVQAPRGGQTWDEGRWKDERTP